MGGIFGVVGKIDRGYLDRMGGRMRHRGAFCTVKEVATGVQLGTCATSPISAWNSGPLAGVAEIAESPGDLQTHQDELLARWSQGGMDALIGEPLPFTFAIWNNDSQSLHLGRDAFGQKPLYYARLPGGHIAFASEYKALLAIDELPAEPDLDALQYFQGTKLMPGMRTLLKHVYCVPPGAQLRLGVDGTESVAQRMRPLEAAVEPLAEHTARDELARRFMEATRSLAAGRSQVAVAISGGIDSIGVAYACRRAAPDAQFLGFTVGFGPDDPEVRTAAHVMEQLGGEHELVTVTPASMAERLPSLVWHLENPIGRSEAFQFLELGRAASRRGVRTIFSGFWADALFAGMPRHKLMWLSDLLPMFRKDFIEYYSLVTAGRPVSRPLSRLMRAVNFKGVGDVPRIAGSDYLPALPNVPAPGPEYLNRFLVADAAENAARSLMRITQPLASGGIDVLTPFLCRPVLEFAFRIPAKFKIKRGKEKYILRQALKSIVPPELLQFGKYPMRMHYDQEFAETLDRLAATYLAPDAVRARGFFRSSDIEGLIRTKQAGKYTAEGGMRLWTAIVTEIWARQFIDRRGAGP